MALLPRDDVESALAAYRARVAMIDGAVSARPDLGEGVLGRARPASRADEGWWRAWFVPAAGPRARLVDLRLAVVIAVVQVAGTIAYSDQEPSRWAFDAFACVLLLIGPVALLFRRRWPEVALAVAFAAAAVYAASGYPRGPAGFPGLGFAVASAIMMGRHAFTWGVVAIAFPASRCQNSTASLRATATATAGVTSAGSSAISPTSSTYATPSPDCERLSYVPRDARLGIR